MYPPCRQCGPIGEQGDVEPMLHRPGVDLLFFFGQEIQQESCEASLIKLFRDILAARTQTSASAAMNEDHYSEGIGWCSQITLKEDMVDWNADWGGRVMPMMESGGHDAPLFCQFPHAA